jgi:hypothetical protein
MLYAAGSPDTVDTKDPHASWEGRAGGLLFVLDTAEGGKRAELRLPAPPVWDGMAAVENHLVISMTDGSVICLKGK